MLTTFISRLKVTKNLRLNANWCSAISLMLLFSMMFFTFTSVASAGNCDAAKEALDAAREDLGPAREANDAAKEAYEAAKEAKEAAKEAKEAAKEAADAADVLSQTLKGEKK